MIVIDGQILKVETLADKSIKVTLVTQELSGGKAGQIIGIAHQHVYFAIKVEAFTKADTDALETLKADYTDTTKSPSKRLRNVFSGCGKRIKRVTTTLNSTIILKCQNSSNIIRHSSTNILTTYKP